jgi:hypothetical protein
MHELRTADDARTRVRRLIGPGSRLPDQTRRDILDLGLAAVPALLEILTDESLALSESRGEGWAPAHATRAERGERPEDCGRDVGPKFVEYEHAGVREYWVLDPETLAHRFYRREGEILVEFASGRRLCGPRLCAVSGWNMHGLTLIICQGLRTFWRESPEFE